MNQLHYESASYVVHDDAGRISRVVLTVPVESFKSIDRTVGTLYNLPRLTTEGRRARHLSQEEFRDHSGLI